MTTRETIYQLGSYRIDFVPGYCGEDTSYPELYVIKFSERRLDSRLTREGAFEKLESLLAAKGHL